MSVRPGKGAIAAKLPFSAAIFRLQGPQQAIDFPRAEPFDYLQRRFAPPN